jgi:hypothetical protein
LRPKDNSLPSSVHPTATTSFNPLWKRYNIESGEAPAICERSVALIWLALVGAFRLRVLLEAENMILRHHSHRRMDRESDHGSLRLGTSSLRPPPFNRDLASFLFDEIEAVRAFAPRTASSINARLPRPYAHYSRMHARADVHRVEHCKQSHRVALRMNPAPRTLRIIGASFDPSTLRRNRPI